MLFYLDPDEKSCVNLKLIHKFQLSDATNTEITESLTQCVESYVDNRLYIQNKPIESYNNTPIIYFVTPTYPRREQIPELTRLAQTLMHIPNIHWIVANDAVGCNGYLEQTLRHFGKFSI